MEEKKIELRIQLLPCIYLISDLAEYLNQPFEETKLKVVNSLPEERDSNNPAWLYDLVQFNSWTYYYDERIKPLSSLADLRILDYGCGIGTAAFYMSNYNQVVGYDINPHLIGFAEYRMKKRGMQNCSFTMTEPDLSDFDLITCIDVLEHFKDLGSFVKHLSKGMKSGARLYHHDCFWHDIPGHYNHTENIDSYIKNAGLIRFDKLWAIKP